MSANLTLTDLPSRIVDRIDTNGPVPTDPSRPVEGRCWIWGGGKFPAGYGSVWLDGVNRLVHQVVLEAVTGTRTDRSVFADHACRVRACCNPDHLDFVTPLGNMLTAQRPACVNGHEYTSANTYRMPNKPNQRQCRECGRVSSRRYAAKMKKVA